jgi:hypothetical protein
MNTEQVLAYLHVTAADGVEHAVPITQSPFCIGRAAHNDLALAEEQISRHHACLRLEGDQIQLVDMGSENGTWIGAARLKENQIYVLAYRETFRIGSYQLRLEPSSAAARQPEEVHAAASSGQRLIEPLVVSSPAGRFGVVLKTPQITVTPGTSTNVSLVVINQGQSSDGFRITLSDIPKAWLPAPPPLVELPPGARQEINLIIHPPRIPESRAGSYRLLVQVTSQSVSAETVEVWAGLTVVPYIAFSSALHPPRTGEHDAARVIVRNTGNAPEVFTVTWRDSENRYEFRPADMRMRLGPGETAAAEFRAILRQRRLFGGSRIDVYSVNIAPEGGQPQSHTGQIVTNGLLPMWSVALLLLVLAVCAVGTGAVAFAMLEPTPTITPTTTIIGMATGTPAPVPTFTLMPTFTPLPTYTPFPTNAPAPTPVPNNTPFPTYTPLPTYTPFPTNTPPPTNTPLPTNTPPPTALPPPVITDWRGEYFGSSDLQGMPLAIRNDTDINFNWGSSSPDPLVPADNFSARWTRTLDVQSGVYRFSIRGDDGLRVFVDDNLIIDEWHAAVAFPPTYTADVNLTAGPHVIRVEYYEATLDAYVVFKYEPVP